MKKRADLAPSTYEINAGFVTPFVVVDAGQEPPDKKAAFHSLAEAQMHFPSAKVTEGAKRKAGGVDAMNDLNLQPGEQVQMTAEGRARFGPPYTGLVVDIGRSGGLHIVRFGSQQSRCFRPRHWERLAAAVGEVACQACGNMAPAEEMDQCLGCRRKYEMCPSCLLSHDCAGRG